MHPEMELVRCAIVRGGTSKGIFIKKNELPGDPGKRDAVLKAIFGSPDIRQIDGLGGADTLTSKCAIISAPTRPDADVDYTFAQVGIDLDIVDYKGNCGNISSAVGPFAIDEGMVEVTYPVTTVRIHQTNTNKILIAEVPTIGGKAAVEGDQAIDGTPGTGARITMDFSDTQGSCTGALLPTGNAVDVIEVEGVPYEISIVDAGNPLVFITADQLQMTGTEKPVEIDENKPLMQRIEHIRGIAAQMIGLVDRWDLAATQSPYLPFFAIVSPPGDYDTFDQKHVKAGDIDLVSRLLFMLKMHKTYPGTGTVCTGAAARIPGSVVWKVLREEAKNRPTINIGHPAGVIPVESVAETVNGETTLKKVAFYRTARRIMEGYVYVRKSVFSQE
jgi:2-methylaconitate cis-trans-isomerase PrpF